MALQKWREISQKLADHQVGSDLDVDIIADAAQHWALMVEGKNAVERDGVVVKNAKGRYVKHPALQVYPMSRQPFVSALLWFPILSAPCILPLTAWYSYELISGPVTPAAASEARDWKERRKGDLIRWVYRNGVERYLAETLRPLAGTRFPEVSPIAVNLPGQ